MKLLILENSDDISIDWDNYIKSNNDCSIYHSIKFINFISDYFNYKKYLFCAKLNDRIVGILPIIKTNSFPYGKQLACLPFIGAYNSVCADSIEIKNSLIEELHLFMAKSNVQFAELREQRENSFELPSYNIYSNYELDISGNINDIWNHKLKSKTRNQTRRALKSNLNWDLKGEEGIDSFYKVYALTMRNLGSPPLSKLFFKSLMGTFPDEMMISIVTMDSEPVSALWLVKSKNKVHNPWAGFIRSYQEYCPNNLNYWKSIEWAKQLNFQVFDFGRSIRNSGQAKFKMQWGVNEVLLKYYYVLNRKKKIPNINPTNQTINFFSKLWKVIPLSLQLQIGEKLASRVP